LTGPRVTVIVPCYNEEPTIQLLLEAVQRQTFPAQAVEVIIADGLSRDRTRQRIAEFQAANPGLSVRVVDNPARNIPAALNLAIAAAQGEIVLRLDAHCVPSGDYIANCVAALEQGRGDSVGGVWEIRPGDDGWQARAIAVAAAHRLGVGDARYRFTNTAQYVDTVPFGAFYRNLVERIGPYNQDLLTNEDYEFNARLRQAGGKIWLDPAIRSVYFARSTLAQLARQYWRYGYWKARMLRRYPETLRWRQALPPAFVLSLAALGMLSVILPAAGWLFMLESVAYILILIAAGFLAAGKQRDWTLVIGVPLAIACMHLAWGSAFLWSMFTR
jgi:succinoglycan biosynthesis protein ExoA